MEWDAGTCIAKFEQLAESTFGGRKNATVLFGRLQQLALSYLRDGQYSSLPIEQAFLSATGEHARMFNPLSSDMKVAVTTTTARESKPCLLANYNGELRTADVGMVNLLPYSALAIY